MSQIDPNIVEISHKEAYIVDDPQRRSPSPESLRPPPIIDEGANTQEHQVMDIVESRELEVRASIGVIRLEERP